MGSKANTNRVLPRQSPRADEDPRYGRVPIQTAHWARACSLNEPAAVFEVTVLHTLTEDARATLTNAARVL